MSAIKAFYEDVSVLIATAIFEEDPDNRDYYKCETYSDTEDRVMENVFDGFDIDDMFEEMSLYITDYSVDMAQEFPKTFTAMSVMAELTDNTAIKNEWKAILKAASESELSHTLFESYKEYYDMADPSPAEARKEIIGSIWNEEYETLLYAWKENIEWRELTEEEYPVTFRAVRLLESIVKLS